MSERELVTVSQWHDFYEPKRLDGEQKGFDLLLSLQNDFSFIFFSRKAQKSHEIMHNRAKLISSNWFRHWHRVEAQNKLFFSIARQRTIRNTCEWLTNQSARSLESGRHERSNITATMFRLTMSLNLIWFIGFNQPNCARRNKSMEREEEKKSEKKNCLSSCARRCTKFSAWESYVIWINKSDRLKPWQKL